TGCAQFDTVGLLSNTGTACGTGGGTFSWTPTAYGVSTSTTLGFLNGFLSTASSTINSNLTITGNSTTTNATTTNAFVTSLLSTSATSSSLFSTTASSTNLFSSLLTVGGNGLVVDSSRNIGIGIAAPTGLLHLNQTPGDLSDNPTISFGDGDSGFYEGADDQMFLSLNTFPLYSFNTTSFQGIANSNGASLSAAAASNVIPTLQPDRTDTNTGLGWNGADQLSLIAGGVEWLRLDNIGSQAFFPTGNVGIGTTSPYAKLSIAGGTSGTAIGVDMLSGYSGNIMELKVASTTKFFVNQDGDLLSSGSSTLQNFTFNNATGTSATTTNFFSTTASSTNSYSSTYYAGNGSASAPAFSFAGDTDTGIYITSANTMNFATGGV
ncbi:MAG: hypothetical protein Q7K33_03745, partial [Candidatus Berkelbacteria bacterium]|nr:hypothetical protein [Candidatus Berkelbacteria bacterium]